MDYIIDAKGNMFPFSVNNKTLYAFVEQPDGSVLPVSVACVNMSKDYFISMGTNAKKTFSKSDYITNVIQANTAFTYTTNTKCLNKRTLTE